MTNINLLPWREKKINIQNKIFAAIACAIVLCCFVASVVVNVYVQALLEHEVSETNLLTSELKLLENKIVQIKGLKERQTLLSSKREIIQALQASRPFIVKLFEDIPNAMPEGVFLLSMSRKENKLTLEGVGASNARISAFMRNLEQLKWLSNTMLQEIKTQDVQTIGAATNKSKEIMFKLEGDITYR